MSSSRIDAGHRNSFEERREPANGPRTCGVGPAPQEERSTPCGRCTRVRARGPPQFHHRPSPDRIPTGRHRKVRTSWRTCDGQDVGEPGRVDVQSRSHHDLSRVDVHVDRKGVQELYPIVAECARCTAEVVLQQRGYERDLTFPQQREGLDLHHRSLRHAEVILEMAEQGNEHPPSVRGRHDDARVPEQSVEPGGIAGQSEAEVGWLRLISDYELAKRSTQGGPERSVAGFQDDAQCAGLDGERSRPDLSVDAMASGSGGIDEVGRSIQLPHTCVSIHVRLEAINQPMLGQDGQQAQDIASHLFDRCLEGGGEIEHELAEGALAVEKRPDECTETVELMDL